jgi:hypothetical protein
MTTSAIDGTNMNGLRAFEVAFTTASTTEKAVAKGSYTLQADVDCYVKVGVTGMSDAATLTTSQPALTAATAKTMRLFAGQAKPWDVVDDVTFIKIIGKTASGTLTIEGPYRHAGSLL